MQPDENLLRSPHERKKTDKSLGIERGKTDKSLKDAQKVAERTNDEAILAGRSVADAARSKNRDEADATQALERVDLGPRLNEEITKANGYLEEERERADEAILTERTLADIALEEERVAKKLIEHLLLDAERNETDRDLADERKQTDIGLQHAAGLLADAELAHLEAKVALTTRDEFLAIVSHDLRNPIGAVSSCASMLLEDKSIDVQGEARNWIEFIKRNADTALRLVSDLLDVERISTGKLDMQLGPHNVLDLVKQAAEVFVSSAAAKLINLQTVQPSSLMFVTCDHDRIIQVLSNLIGNAVKFTPEHGTITLHVQSFKNNAVQVSVSDTGPGIPNDKKMLIFERFSQLGRMDRQGLGLGLYIAKKILAAHHQKISVESTLGEGSTFSFTLPKASYH